MAGAGAGGAAGACAAGAGGAAGAGAGAGAFEATSSSSDFLPLLRFFRLTAEPLLVTEMQDSELQFRGASMWIFCPSIWNEIPLPAWAAVEAISKAAAAAR